MHFIQHLPPLRHGTSSIRSKIPQPRRQSKGGRVGLGWGAPWKFAIHLYVLPQLSAVFLKATIRVAGDPPFSTPADEIGSCSPQFIKLAGGYLLRGDTLTLAVQPHAQLCLSFISSELSRKPLMLFDKRLQFPEARLPLLALAWRIVETNEFSSRWVVQWCPSI